VQPNASNSKRRITAIPEPVDEETLIQIATETFVKELGLEDDTVLRGGKVEIREVPAGTYLMKEESHKVSIGMGGIFTQCKEVNFVSWFI
jgi:lysophospholipid hydrolase